MCDAFTQNHPKLVGFVSDLYGALTPFVRPKEPNFPTAPNDDSGYFNNYLSNLTI